MINQRTINNYSATFITSITLLLIIHFFMATANLNYIFNSDQLNLSYLYKDLLQQQGHLKDWTISNTNYLFPDGVLVFFYSALLQHFKWVILLTNSTILILYYLIMVATGVLICGDKFKNTFRMTVILSLMLGCGHLREQEIFLPLLISHFSSCVVIYLFLLFLCIKYLNTHKKFYYYLLLSIALYTFISDPLAMPIVVGSVFFGFVGLFRITKSIELILFKKIFISLIAVAIASLVVIKIHLLGLHIGKAPTQFVLSTTSTLALYHALLGYAQHNAIILILAGCYLLITGFMFFRLIFFKKQVPVFFKKLDINTLFILFSTGSSVAILILLSIALDKDLMEPGFNGLRHFNTAILIPVFLGLPILLVKYTNFGAWINRGYIVLISIVCAGFLILSKNYSLDLFLNYYPASANCIDYYYQSGQLQGKNGIAEYWDAHLNNMFSKNNLNIVAVTSQYIPYNWMATKHDYMDKKFNYIIFHKSDPHLVSRQKNAEQFGKPSAILSCPGETMLIYSYKTSFSLPVKK